MNTLLLIIIGFPILEIIFMIKVGQQVGAINTVVLILLTATLGVFFARIQGLNTLKSGFMQLSKNKPPTYEMISGAAIAFAALLLIIPGFATDILGFLLIFPISRNFFFGILSKKFKHKGIKENNFIDGDYKDIENDDDRKI